MAILPRWLTPVLTALVLSTAALAADSAGQIWIISTREASCSGMPQDAAEAMQYWRLGDGCGWAAADAREFTEDTSGMPIVVFIHGNGTNADRAVVKGMYVHRTISCAVGDRPFRFVIWSWFSDRVCRRARPDVQVKAAYSDEEGYYLAHWLASLPSEAKICLVGHSFGPRVINSAMHVLAGGEVAGQRLPENTMVAWHAKKPNTIRAVMLATADDCDAMAPSGRHCLALSMLDEVLVTCNCRDRMLRYYPRLYGRGGPDAMGFVGPCGIGNAENVSVVDVSCTVGKPHDYRCYCSASNVSCQWSHYTFLDEQSQGGMAKSQRTGQTLLAALWVSACRSFQAVALGCPQVPAQTLAETPAAGKQSP
jgi:hypothetical protein